MTAALRFWVFGPYTRAGLALRRGVTSAVAMLAVTFTLSLLVLYDPQGSMCFLPSLVSVGQAICKMIHCF